MIAERLEHYAVAARMGCLREGGGGAVVVTAREGGSALPGTAEARVACAAGAKAAEVADAAAAFARAKGVPPPAVLVGNSIVLEVRRAKRAGRLQGCVAIVTGSAQGFGEGIAREIAAEGAFVTVADLNGPLAEKVAADLNRRFGPDTALCCRTDVADSDSVAACVARTVRAWGGVDLLVANAGVLRAGGVDTLAEEDFDLVTNVNYKGYFLCVRAVAPVMKLQHALYPARTMDIIQINSKSGLAGSMKNFAYAGSKFGGIGLTQSFALELLPHGVKVNAVCPGNYLDGPLWSDPENGIFVQYLKIGKIPGARSVEDVRRHYETQVPIGRGCTPRDVARAIFYLREQEYETGQALPVTGGQTMLK